MASRIQKELALLITGRDVSASKALRGVNKEVKGLQRAAGKAGTNISRNIERGVVLGAGAAVGAIGFAVKAAMDWDQAFSGVRKTLTATPAELAAIGVAIRKMSTEMPVAATELAAIAENAGALGIATGDVVEFTKVVALLGVTTDLTSESAGTALGHLKTNLKLVGADFAEVGNTLVSLGNNGASTESQILGMAEAISGAANIVGLSAKEVLGWGAALANTGIEVEAGGTSLQKFFLGTFKMVNDGGKKLKVLAKTAGMTSAQFKKAYEKDASGALETFVVALGKMSKAEQAATLENLGFTDIRITRALLSLLGNTDNLTDSLNQADSAWAANNAMQKEADQRFKTTASQVKLLENNVNDAAITIGSELLPVVNELAKEGIDWLHGHQGEIAAFAKDLAAGIRDAVKWAKSLDWNAIGGALKAGAGFAKGLVEAFASAPPWLQQFLAVGFVANKFTGGAVQDVIGSLASGLIKGVLGMTAGVVNINAGVVNGGGLPGVPPVLGPPSPMTSTGPGGILSALGVAVAGFAAGQATKDAVDAAGAKAPKGSLLSLLTDPNSDAFKTVAQNREDQLTRAGLTGAVSDADLDGAGFRRVADTSTDAAEKIKGAVYGAGGLQSEKVTHSISALGLQLNRDIHGLRKATKPVDIAKFARSIQAEVAKGGGSTAGTKSIVADLRKKLGQTHDPKLQAILRTAIHAVEAKIPGREWVDKQLAKADKIIAGTDSTKQKITDLNSIQRTLRDRGDTHAAALINAKILTLNSSVNALPPKIGAYLAPTQNTGGGGMGNNPVSGPPSSPAPAPRNPNDNDSPALHGTQVALEGIAMTSVNILGATTTLTTTTDTRLGDVIAKVEAARVSTATATASVAAAARAAGAANVAAINAKDLVTETYVTVPITNNISVRDSIKASVQFAAYQRGVQRPTA